MNECCNVVNKERSLTHLSSLLNKPKSLKKGTPFFVRSIYISEVHVCMCVRVLLCLGPEHLKPHSYRPLTYHGAIPGLTESCCVALVWPIAPAAKRERRFGWVAVDKVAMTHDQGRGHNRLSSLGPSYRCYVDYEA